MLNLLAQLPKQAGEGLGKLVKPDGLESVYLDPIELAGTIINTFLSILGIVFLVLAIYGGFIWMKARGNEKEVERAKNILTDSIIGIIIVFAAYAISIFVIQALS